MVIARVLLLADCLLVVACCWLICLRLIVLVWGFFDCMLLRWVGVCGGIGFDALVVCGLIGFWLR